MDSKTQPKVLDKLDISDEDFVCASSFTPAMNTHVTHTHYAQRDSLEWLRTACVWCGTIEHDAQTQSCEVLRDARGVGQLCVCINAEFFVGSGSVCLLGPSTDFTTGTKYFFLTCAHNFLHYKSTDQPKEAGETRDDNEGKEEKGNETETKTGEDIDATKEPGIEMETKTRDKEWHEATAAVFHYGKVGPETYAVRSQVLDFRIHPKFRSGTQGCAGFDVAVGLLAGNFENAPRCENSYWSYYEYLAPLRVGEAICVVGYPSERGGSLHKLNGTIGGIVDVAGGGKLLTYNNINTCGGQGGAPVYLTRGDCTVLIGIHLGYDTNLRANVATLITKEIQEWIYKQLKH
eukprot:Phypoly_transcript_10112.p1 GENE.Phypoly_transcript_10112~~Phypoly_transcript_10112.p1  ORF type:complete len:347 (+),score=45.78 Phypoly_transcript_10112:102-1142(+)